MEEGIHTEAQLAAAIEAEQWYDSDSDTEGTDSGGGDSNTNDTLNGEVRRLKHLDLVPSCFGVDSRVC